MSGDEMTIMKCSFGTGAGFPAHPRALAGLLESGADEAVELHHAVEDHSVEGRKDGPLPVLVVGRQLGGPAGVGPRHGLLYLAKQRRDGSILLKQLVHGLVAGLLHVLVELLQVHRLSAGGGRLLHRDGGRD
eukprot:scaffold117564_cov45-Prasinocladus_malaysianus.AAC.7